MAKMSRSSVPKRFPAAGLGLLVALVAGCESAPKTPTLVAIDETGQPNPRSVLLAARTAMAACRNVRFDLREEYRIDGLEASAVSASVLFERLQPDPFGARFVIRGERTGGRGAGSFNAVYDGELIRSIDEEAREVRETAPGPRSFASYTNPIMRFGRLYLSETVFDRELDAATLTHEGVVDVGGHPCDEILAEYGVGSRRAAWFIGKEDRLLRGARFMTSNAAGRGVEITVKTSGFVANDDLPADAFAVAVPEGFAVREYATPSPTARAATTGLLEVGTAAPPFTLKDGSGAERSLADARGKLVVLDFWATWCGPCKRVMPRLQELHDAYAERGVEVIGISCRERSGDPRAYMEQQQYTYGLLVDGNDVADAYKVTGIPTMYVIDGTGQIIHAHRGAAEGLFDDLIKVIDEQLVAEGQEAADDPATSRDSS